MNCGNSCAEIFRMFEGYYGPYYTPAVDEDGNLSWTNNAGLPNPPAISIKGDPGTGLEISGLAATEGDLPATAEDWTCYLVGTEIPYTVYTYNPNNGWMSLGELASGPKGDPGAVYTPSVSPEGLLSWTNDGGLPNPEPVNIKGPPGGPGDDGVSPVVTVEEIPDGHRVTITDAEHPEGQSFDVMDGEGGSVTVDDALSDSSTNPVQNKVVKAAVDAKYTKPATGIPASDLATGVIPDAEVFWASYTFTTSAQIEAAYQAGKVVLCKYSGLVYVLTSRSSATSHTFTTCLGQSIYEISCIDSIWYNGSSSLAPLSSPTFTGTPKAPTAASGTNTTQIATTAFVQNEVAGKYTKPSGGIPKADLASAVQASLDKADTALQGDGLSDDVKQALLQLAQKVAYIDAHGFDYYQDLYDALYPSTPIELTGITATFTQGTHTIFDTDSLDDLKPYLTVTANYSDSSSAAVTTYTLSGTLTAGTSTITVTYQGKTATFTVTVSHMPVMTGITATFNQGSATIYDTDSLDSLKTYLTVTADYDTGASSTVTNYTLSGTLAAGTSTITTSYSGFTDTFTVTVTERIAVLESITASFSQGSATIYDDDSLNSLKQYLTVTAHYDDSTSAAVSDYTLSGTLSTGTSTITVTYNGKTDTFNVTVTHRAAVYTVSNTLEHCTSSNAATSATEGDSYSATIISAQGYMLNGATVRITMGGTDITSTAYSNGTISIANVTGNISISVSAVQVVMSSISASYTQSGTVYDTDSLDSLKSNLVVTATYNNGSTVTVPSADYTLSGTLAVGTSTITVSYGGKTTTFNVTVTKEPQYVMDDLELWLDARKYKNLTDYRQITDQSGNNVTLTFNGTSATQVHFYDKFVNVGVRGSLKVDSAAFVALLASGWTIETTFQNRYYSADNGTSTPTDGGNNRMASFVNGRAIINTDSRVQLLTNNTYYGTARDLTDGVNTISVTYDGTTLTEYLNGVEIYSASASIDMTTPTFFELFGNAGYAANAACSWNAARVYSEVLTAAEIKDNYDLDVVNYGTVNIAEAPAGA